MSEKSHKSSEKDEQNTSQQEPLLEAEKKVEDVQIPFKEAVSNVWTPARWVILNAIFHPVFSIVNAMVLGHQDNEKMLAGLGLGSLTIGICALSIGATFNQALGTFVSQAHGQKEHRQCQVYRNKAIFCATMIYCVILVPLIFIRQIYTAMGQDDEMAEYASQYVHYTAPFILFYFVG